MRKYRFQFLDIFGNPAKETTLEATDDAEALELARLLNHMFGIRVCCGNREVGTVFKGPIVRPADG